MQKIIVKNFRQIPNADIEVKRILFLIGEQASGKSTLAKLIYFFKSLKQDYFNLIYEQNHQSNRNLETAFIKNIQEKFRVYFGYTSDLDKSFEITYYYDYSKNQYIKLSKNKSLNVQFEKNFFSLVVNKTRELAREIEDFSGRQSNTKNVSNYITYERVKSKFIDELNSRVGELFKDHRTPLFFPAGRNITVSYPEQFQTLFFGEITSKYNNNLKNNDSRTVDMVLMREFIGYSKFMIDYFRKTDITEQLTLATNSKVADFLLEKYQLILKGKYANNDGIESIEYDDNTNNVRAFPLQIASSGQQESIRIIQDLLYTIIENSPAFRIIEEPEAHLYPKAQKNLIELLIFAVNKTDSQVIITTHSPYVVTLFNNLLFYSRVLKRVPDSKSKIEKHFNTQSLRSELGERINIDLDDMQAYSLSTNRKEYYHSIIDIDTGLIGENFLDAVTEDINDDFDFLYSINKTANIPALK